MHSANLFKSQHSYLGGSKVQYLFTLRNDPFPGVLTPPQQQLASAMKNDWTNLARTGIPSSHGGPLWPRFDTVGQQMLSLAPPRPQVETSFSAEHHCGFWAQAG